MFVAYSAGPNTSRPGWRSDSPFVRPETMKHGTPLDMLNMNNVLQRHYGQKTMSVGKPADRLHFK